jgi:hypothetical protein
VIIINKYEKSVKKNVTANTQIVDLQYQMKVTCLLEVSSSTDKTHESNKKKKEKKKKTTRKKKKKWRFLHCYEHQDVI